jgi:Na+/H+-dicarboxylate symporter
MPIEGVVILEAADTIPDVIKTILNVTGDMSVATILDRPAVDPAAAVPTGIAVPAEV